MSDCYFLHLFLQGFSHIMKGIMQLGLLNPEQVASLHPNGPLTTWVSTLYSLNKDCLCLYWLVTREVWLQTTRVSPYQPRVCLDQSLPTIFLTGVDFLMRTKSLRVTSVYMDRSLLISFFYSSFYWALTSEESPFLINNCQKSSLSSDILGTNSMRTSSSLLNPL